MIQQTAAEQLKKRDRAKVAVSLAMERKWEDAIGVNKEILEETPDNIEALSRLGKALSEIGRYRDARAAFQRVLDLAPGNGIAKKNLDRIASLRDEKAPKAVSRQAVPPNFFIEETGKTGVTALIDLAGPSTVAKLTAGETVVLEPQEHKLLVRNSQGEYVGTVEPKLGLRLLRMIRGGNRYAAGIASVRGHEVKVIIKETFQHPTQQGRLSFPPKGRDGFRGDTWEGAGRFLAEDEDEGPGEASGEASDDDGANLDDVSTYRRGSRGQRDSDESEEEES